jgi:hypothetical protein
MVPLYDSVIVFGDLLDFRRVVPARAALAYDGRDDEHAHLPLRSVLTLKESLFQRQEGAALSRPMGAESEPATASRIVKAAPLTPDDSPHTLPLQTGFDPCKLSRSDFPRTHLRIKPQFTLTRAN